MAIAIIKSGAPTAIAIIITLFFAEGGDGGGGGGGDGIASPNLSGNILKIIKVP